MSNTLNNCIFCQIIKKEILSKIIYENHHIIAFLDTKPIAPIHFLIIPKQHIETLAECNEKHRILLSDMLLLAQKIAKKAGYGYIVNKNNQKKQGGFKIFLNVGPNGGQEIYHLHMHVTNNKINKKI